MLGVGNRPNPSHVVRLKVAIHWFRYDLRPSDNMALHAACREANAVVPVFIFDPLILKAPDTGAPIVDHRKQRLKTLAMFKRV